MDLKRIINKTFSESDLDSLPDDIYGVYAITVDGKVIYVGKNKDQSIHKRTTDHYSSNEENELLAKELLFHFPDFFMHLLMELKVFVSLLQHA